MLLKATYSLYKTRKFVTCLRISRIPIHVYNVSDTQFVKLHVKVSVNNVALFPIIPHTSSTVFLKYCVSETNVLYQKLSISVNTRAIEIFKYIFLKRAWKFEHQFDNLHRDKLKLLY